MKKQSIIATVIFGKRIYTPFAWTRKDTIYVGNIKIGYFYTSREDRTGSTVSLNNGLQIKGRNLEWCLEHAGPLLDTASHKQSA